MHKMLMGALFVGSLAMGYSNAYGSDYSVYQSSPSTGTVQSIQTYIQNQTPHTVQTWLTATGPLSFAQVRTLRAGELFRSDESVLPGTYSVHGTVAVSSGTVSDINCSGSFIVSPFNDRARNTLSMVVSSSSTTIRCEIGYGRPRATPLKR